MSDMNNSEYYSARAEAARKLAALATDPDIAAIHKRMAADYEALATDQRQHEPKFVKA